MSKNSGLDSFSFFFGERLSCIPLCTQIFWLPHSTNSITARLIQTKRRILQKPVRSLKQNMHVYETFQQKNIPQKYTSTFRFVRFSCKLVFQQLRWFSLHLTMHNFQWLDTKWNTNWYILQACWLQTWLLSILLIIGIFVRTILLIWLSV